MNILFVTQRQVGDRSFGGAQRANALREALLSIATVDSLVIHGGPSFTAAPEWDDRRIREATFSRWGLSREALSQRSQMSRWIGRIIREGRYDVIVVQYLDLALLLGRQDRRRMIFDPDDYQKSDSGASLPGKIKLALRNRLARRIARRARHVWYNNPAPAQTPSTDRRTLLPNIVDLPDPSRARQSPVPNRLLMVGFFEYAPNSEGLAWFHDRVLPLIKARLPDVELHAIGRSPDDLRAALPDVTFHGFVDDLAAEYDRAAVVIAPVRSGSGTQIKVIDALAHGRPVIVSGFAHAGFAADLHDGEHLLVAHEPGEWVAQSIRALTDSGRAQELADAGERIVRERYGPEAMRRIVADTIASL